MTVHRIDLNTIRPTPWRNGGGVTRELLQWPPHSRPDTWRVRVSVADIELSGPFSSYPGIERWFAVLEGEGVKLALPYEGGDARTLGVHDEPVHFPGEDPPHCHLLRGRTRDLNLMLRRGQGSGRLSRAQARASVDGATQWRALYSHGSGRLDIDGVAEPLHAGLLLWTETQDASCWRLLDGTQAYWMVLES